MNAIFVALTLYVITVAIVHIDRWAFFPSLSLSLSPIKITFWGWDNASTLDNVCWFKPTKFQDCQSSNDWKSESESMEEKESDKNMSDLPAKQMLKLCCNWKRYFNHVVPIPCKVQDGTWAYKYTIKHISVMSNLVQDYYDCTFYDWKMEFCVPFVSYHCVVENKKKILKVNHHQEHWWASMSQSCTLVKTFQIDSSDFFILFYFIFCYCIVYFDLATHFFYEHLPVFSSQSDNPGSIISIEWLNCTIDFVQIFLAISTIDRYHHLLLKL